MARKDRTKIAKLADDALDREERTRLTGELVERRSPTLISALAAIELAPGVGGALGHLMADLLERKCQTWPGGAAQKEIGASRLSVT